MKQGKQVGIHLETQDKELKEQVESPGSVKTSELDQIYFFSASGFVPQDDMLLCEPSNYIFNSFNPNL